jgi:pilus assembly protein CpaB
VTKTRRRGLLLLCFALVCGGLAASQVRERERRAEAAVGPLVSVVVVRRDLPAERRLRAGDLALRRVPARFAPPDAMRSPELLIGVRAAVPLAAGAYVTAALLEGSGSGRGGGLRPGERAVELAVGGGGALALAGPGWRVDVLVSTQRESGGRTFIALEDVELLGLRAAGSGGSAQSPGEPSPPTALATLRVTARQAVYLTAAGNFAQEIRLLVRPPGDRKRVGAAAVGEGGL